MRVIEDTRRTLLKHPAAAQSAYRALVAEGRAYAQTDEGRAWRTRLDASVALRRLRPLWEAATLNLLDGAEGKALPGAFIEMVAQALSRADLEALTAALTSAPPPRRRR